MTVTSQISILMCKCKYMIADVHTKTRLARSIISNPYNDKEMRVDYDNIQTM